MKIDFSIDADDFLAYQLYIASSSERIRKRRKRSWLIPAVIYVSLGLISLLFGDKVFALIILTISIGWLLIYPSWESRHYYKHYKDFVDEHSRERWNVPVSIEFENEWIVSKDAGSESKLSYGELEEVVEIPTAFLLRIRGGLAYIIPKKKINVAAFRSFITELTNKLNITFTTDNNWRWK